MFRMLFLLPCCLLSASLSAQSGKILTHHRARLEATTNADTAALSIWLDPGLRYVHSNGLVEDKHAHLQHVESGRIHYASMTDNLAPAVARWGRTALMEGLLLVSGTYEGRDFRVGLHYTAVYRKSNGRWRLRAWQSTRVASD